MVPRFLIRWLVTSLAILVIPSLLAGVQVPDFRSALAMALVLGVFNVLVKPILLLITLPLTILTLGLFWLVINALLFEWAGTLVHGVHVRSFSDAFLAALLVSAVSWFLHISVDRKRRPRVQVRMSRGGGFGPRGGRPIPDSGERDIEMHEDEGGNWKL
jgi:putative membrane protein